MVSYSKICMLHFSVNILRLACVVWKQNKVTALTCIKGGVRKIAGRKSTKFSQRKYIRKIHILVVIWFNFINRVFVSTIIYLYYSKTTVKKSFAIYSKSNIQNIFILYIWFAIHRSLNNGISFYRSNLIRVKFKVNRFRGFLLIIAMEIWILPRYRAVRSNEIASACANSVQS